jgi:hypothetical protein
MERLVRRLKTTGLSITTNHKNPILKYEGLGNQLMHAACVTCLALPLAATQSLESQVLEDSQSRWCLTIATEN